MEDASLDGLITYNSIENYTDLNAKTVILDASTGERIPHWIEDDQMDLISSKTGIFMIQPAVPLKHATR